MKTNTWNLAATEVVLTRWSKRQNPVSGEQEAPATDKYTCVDTKLSHEGLPDSC